MHAHSRTALSRRHFAVGCLLLTPTLGCQSIPVSRPSSSADIPERIHSYVDSLTRVGSFAGTVLVAQRDHILFERSYGLGSVELNVPNSNSSRYRLHSITKQFTALAVVLLEQKGLVDLNASVRRYLPELPVSWERATIKQVLTHTSGIPNAEGVWANSFMAHDVHTQLENLAFVAPKLARDTLLEVPGTVWRYNNFAYDLLACLIERMAQQPYEDFVKMHILTPAGMRNAGFDRRRQAGGGGYVASAPVSGLVSGYNGAPNQLMVAAPNMFASTGAGGMYATARDLLSFDQALTAGTIVPLDVELRTITSAYQVRPGVSYGYGWVVSGDMNGSYFVHHSGGNNGFVTEYARFPRERTCIVILSNRGFADPEGMRKTMAHMLFGDRYK